MPAQKLSPLLIITVPLALRSSGDTAAFTEAAERNVQEMHDMAVSINENLIPGINAAVDPLNTLVDNLPAVQNAAANANTAIQKAAAAATSATAAAGSATAANTAKAGAEAAKTAAQTSESNANSSKNAAADSAGTATTQAGVATTKAGEAASSATAAAGSATAANTAKAGAETAKTAAQTAETNANASKNAAAGSATAAAGSATGANTAKTGAEAAKVAAEKARDAAQSAVTDGIPDASTTVKGLVKYGAAAGTAAQGNHTHAAQTTVTGNAGTATKLATARTLQTNLAVATAANFDGTANNIHGVTGILPVANGGTGNTTGNAATATKLGTARTISLTGAVTGSISFDGSKNVGIPTAIAASWPLKPTGSTFKVLKGYGAVTCPSGGTWAAILLIVTPSCTFNFEGGNPTVYVEVIPGGTIWYNAGNYIAAICWRVS